MTKLRDRVKASRGFSMSELLVCLLILMLSTGVGVQVISSGIEHYQENTRNSEAITLANNLAVAVRDQLAFTTSVDTGSNPQFESTANTLENVPCKIVVIDEEGNPLDTPGSWGYVALKYSVEQANNDIAHFTYFPVSKTDYEKGISNLKAKINYEYEDGLYTVTVTVHDENNRIVEHEKKFSVSPVSDLVGEGGSA